MEFYGEKDCFRKDKIKIAKLQISTDLPSTKEAQSLVQDHNRKNIAMFYSRKTVDSIPYENLFEEVKNRVEEMPYKGDTPEAEKKFFQRHGNLVIISGQPGIGKTTLTKCMLDNMWNAELFQADIVFFIRFRKVDYQEESDFLQFLAPGLHNIIEVKDRKSILKRLEKRDNVFILMDGLDEANIDPKMRSFKSCNIHSKNVYTAERFIQNLLAGEILPNSKKLITSRPHRITQLQKTDFKPIVLFTIQGIDKKARKQICSSICGKNDKRCKQILDYLRAHPDLESHCHTPVICIMVMEGLDNKYDAAEKSNADTSCIDFVMEKSDSTLTAIFVYALENWLLKKLDTNGDAKFPIKNICKFALEKYYQGQWYFPCHELEEQGVDNQHWSTFLNTFLDGNQELYFIHLMWQEFLAAVKLRLYTKKEDYGNVRNPESVLSKLSSKQFEAVTTRFLYGLCNKSTLATLLRNITLEEDRNNSNERLACEEMLTDFAVKKLETFHDAEYLSGNGYDSYDDSSSDDEDKVFHDFNADSCHRAIPHSSGIMIDTNTNTNVYVGDTVRSDSDNNDHENVNVGSGDDVDNDIGEVDNDSHDDTGDDFDEKSYFASVLPTLGWVHEMDDDNFTFRAAEFLKKRFIIEHQILPSDIPVIMHILRARQSKMILKVVYPRFLGNCFKYFFQELHKLLKEKKNIQVSHQSIFCLSNFGNSTSQLLNY